MSNKDTIRIQIKELVIRGGINTTTSDISMIVAYNDNIKHLTTIIKIDGKEKIEAVMKVAQTLLHLEGDTNA